jgi:hypothetical protein
MLKEELLFVRFSRQRRTEAYMPTTTLTRSLLVIILPGLFAAAPWLFILMSRVQASSVFYDKYPILGNACLFAFVVILGCVFEGANSSVETTWDKERETTYDVETNWYNYLALVCTAEPVGFKYIVRKVTGMYFELAMVWASYLFGVGVIGLLSANSMLLWAVIIAVFSAAVPYYFWKQAKDSHKVLCVCRKELNFRLYASRQTSLPSGGTFQLSEG